MDSKELDILGYSYLIMLRPLALKLSTLTHSLMYFT